MCLSKLNMSNRHKSSYVTIVNVIFQYQSAESVVELMSNIVKVISL